MVFVHHQLLYFEPEDVFSIRVPHNTEISKPEILIGNITKSIANIKYNSSRTWLKGLSTPYV